MNESHDHLRVLVPCLLSFVKKIVAVTLYSNASNIISSLFCLDQFHHMIADAIRSFPVG